MIIETGILSNYHMKNKLLTVNTANIHINVGIFYICAKILKGSTNYGNGYVITRILLLLSTPYELFYN